MFPSISNFMSYFILSLFLHSYARGRLINRNIAYNIVFAKGGPPFPIEPFSRVAVALQAHMPTVHPKMTIWGMKGGSPLIFCYSQIRLHHKFYIPRPSASDLNSNHSGVVVVVWFYYR